MSAKNAPGEVNKNPNFDSPNISSAEDEEQMIIDAAEKARKEAETVEIDGIPIEEKELKFKAEDIKKKGKTEYFVNVEGAEERKKEAAKKAREEALAAEAEAKAKKAAAEKAATEKKIADAKAKAEAEKRQKAEDTRVIGELKQKAKTRKKENRQIKRKEHQRKVQENITNTRRSIHNFFFGGWHKKVTFTVIAVIITAIVGVIVFNLIKQETARVEEERQAKIDSLNTEILDLLDKDPQGSKEQILNNAKELDNIQQNEGSAIDVMNWARYYEDDDLYNEYHQKCVDRGGCKIDTEGQG